MRDTVAGDTSEAFGALLRRYRRSAGLTQEALAEKTGLSVRAISGMERGEGHAPVVAALQPIDAFGRVYAAYGGFFVALALTWGVLVEGWRPASSGPL